MESFQVRLNLGPKFGGLIRLTLKSLSVNSIRENLMKSTIESVLKEDSQIIDMIAQEIIQAFTNSCGEVILDVSFDQLVKH
jgi:hypothetical protein